MTLDFSDTINNHDNINSVNILQASISYSGLRKVRIKAGQFFEPFSLEGTSGSNTLTFMERGLPFTFHPSRNKGIGISIAPAKGFIWKQGDLRMI